MRLKTGERRSRLLLEWACLAVLALAAPGRALPGDQDPGLDQHPGGQIPAEVRCVTEQGETIRLRDLADRPMILSLVYYRCMRICPQVQVALGRLVQDLGLGPGRDYRIVTFSFDPEDGPSEAAEARKNYTLPLGRDLPAGAWTFVTASAPDIARLTAAIGFGYRKEMHGFIHPVVLVLVAPGGTIARYILPSRFDYGVAYPVAFSSLEFREALDDARRGLVAPPAAGPLLFCFEHKPPQQDRYFRLMTVSGYATLATLALLFVYLSVARRRS
jgi:protein SCO1/2